jgi:hypothetical protein
MQALSAKEASAEELTEIRALLDRFESERAGADKEGEE